MYLTINEFSYKTGLPASTLRFYDRKAVLVPECRLENGYRAYSPKQIATAHLIHSLRCADISIPDIKEYLQADEGERDTFIHQWRLQIEEKLSLLQVAKRYLGGLQPKENILHLTKWEEHTTFLWFKHKVPRQEHPFQEAMLQDQEQMKGWGLKGAASLYLRTLDVHQSQMHGEVGFIVDPAKLSLPTNLELYDAYLQTLSPTVFAMLECSTRDPFICFYFIQLVKQYGFKVAGIKLEKFATPFAETFTYYIPILSGTSQLLENSSNNY